MMDIQRIKVACGDCRLSPLCLSSGLNEEEMARLGDLIPRARLLQTEELLYRQGEPLDALYAVRSGSLRTFAGQGNGQEQTLGFSLPGDLVGLDGLEDERHQCSSVALETTTLCELPYARFRALCAEIPSLQGQMLHLIGKEICAEHGTLFLRGNRSAEARVAIFLLDLARRFGVCGLSRQEFNLSMSRHEIADYLGIAGETVSRQLGAFQRRGLIAVQQRNVRILDPVGLDAVAAQDGEAQREGLCNGTAA
jgi:CRP/FNR family transcriptional regulator